MNKFLIVDGHNLLFQMFYGMPSRIVNREGKAIHGVLGFVGALLKIIKLVSPTHVVVLFDGEHKNVRTQINADYKMNRKDYTDAPDEDNPFSQLNYIFRALEFIGIKYKEEDEFEVDDIVASYVKTCDNVKTVISSFDSDYFQLINDEVSVLRYRGKNTQICDREYVLKKFGIFPEFYADFKSLTGDQSDNVKGVEKVGVKTASALIQKFGSIENLIKRSDEIEREYIRNSIKKNEKRIRDNYKLIKLENLQKIPFSLEQLEFSDRGLTTNYILKGIGLLD